MNEIFRVLRRVSTFVVRMSHSVLSVQSAKSVVKISFTLFPSCLAPLWAARKSCSHRSWNYPGFVSGRIVITIQTGDAQSGRDAMCSVPKARNVTAQGNALGKCETNASSPNGAKGSCRACALSGNAVKDFLCQIPECCRATLFPGTRNPNGGLQQSLASP